jgi:HEAT repeat protein
LIECTADASDGLRMNAARALRLAPSQSVVEIMQRLVADPSSRVRLIAASSLLDAEPGNTAAIAALVESLEDPVRGVHEAARELLDSLGAAGVALIGALNDTSGQIRQPELTEVA